MELTREQYEQIEPFLPKPRGIPGGERLDNLTVINAIVYVAEQGCKWRGLPTRFGHWHTIYTRMNRWAKRGVLERLFIEMPQRQMVRIKLEDLSMDSTIVRVHPDEAPVLKEYVLSLAQEALDALSASYNMEVEGPILVEVFPRHDDFAVRNLGLPGMIGALGACFGRVVTMDSPRARPPGDFNWRATLWHEMAHVITLQMSAQRVPRWLTEGISVYEEQRARPAWGRDQEMTFARALNEDRVLALSELNAGFSRPDTISLAYFQASVLVEHIVDAYGEAALHELVAKHALDGRAVVSSGHVAAFRGLGELAVSSFSKIVDGYDVIVDAPQGGILVVNNTYLPYWRATADGKVLDTVPANAIHMAIAVPKGVKRIKIRYHRPTLKEKWTSFFN